jgi:hypothetical protein
VQAGVVPKAATGARRADQNTIDALKHLRDAGLVPWEWIEDETRTLDQWATAATVAEYVAGAVGAASIDRWDGAPAPLILCESRSLAGALRATAALYACPIASTNGQTGGFLITKVAPAYRSGQPVLYLGDFDWCGQQIEVASRRTLVEDLIRRGRVGDAGDLADRWERVALTSEQAARLGDVVIQKPDRRYRPVRFYEAVETEAFGQARIVAAVTARLDELMPEPLNGVLERQAQQRAEVAEQLRQLRD